jgi:antitoxin component YwqK of YwqJK toxin-antitoxin module
MLRINRDDSDMHLIGFDVGGGEIYHYKNNPFTGMLFENYPNGNLNYEIECVNGYPEGAERHYYQNGQLMEESYLKYNLSYGIMKEWDEDGNL